VAACKKLSFAALVVLSLMGCRSEPPPSAPAQPTTLQSRERPSQLERPSATFVVPIDTATPSASATPTPDPIAYQAAFGIDYTDPGQYLVQGDQTQISDPTALNPLRIQAEGMAHMAHIYRWLHREFESYPARGATVGVSTVDGLLIDRQMGGCHDFGLVFAAAVRELGYPAVMVESYSIAWIEQFQAGTAEGHVGHVFVEVYLEGRWVLVDPTNGWYVDVGYDPGHPTIPIKGAIAGSSDEAYGFYVDRKGADSWAYGVTNLAELSQVMDDLAGQIDLATVSYPPYEFKHFQR
jgi:hypothetical protein